MRAERLGDKQTGRQKLARHDIHKQTSRQKDAQTAKEKSTLVPDFFL